MEQDRLDLQHNIYLLMLDGKLHLAPLEGLKGGIHNALDIATGTGIWAMDFGMMSFYVLFDSMLEILFFPVHAPRPLLLRFDLVLLRLSTLRLQICKTSNY